jgi:polyisoprenoid-binding protein YceI
MKKLISASFLTFAALALTASSARAATWEIDGAHTAATFKVRHLAVSWVRGQFGTVTGTIDYEAGKPESIKADVSIDVASIDTSNEKRDEHLRSPDFFDVAKHPKITFKSKRVQKAGAEGFELVGDLTIRGTTKEVALKVEAPAAPTKDPWGNTKTGTTATLTINRHDFGVAFNKVLETGGLVVGNDVHITLEIEVNQKAAK